MNRMLFLLTTFAFVSLPILAADATAEREPRQSKPQSVANFSLFDYRGRHVELHRADARVVVLFVAGNGCPIVRQSISKVRSLRGKFTKDGVVFWMLNANSQDDRESIVEEARSFNVGSIPILLDEHQFVARSLGVTRTAEAIAISTKDSTILYRGAIDDQLTEGAKKPAPTEKYLETALAEFLAEKPVTLAKAPVKGCLIKFENAPKDDDQPVSYTKVIAPMLHQKCVGCHSSGNIGPFAMSSHKKVKGWSEMIREVVLAKRMPPWHADPHFGKFANDRSLTADETGALLRWIEQDCPRGDGEDPLALAQPKAERWALGEPDLIVPLPRPQSIPATGVLQYRYVDSQFEMPQDGWLRAVVLRPDNRKVVHHVIVRVKYPEGAKGKPEEEVFLTSWAPGNTTPECPPGTGKFLPKGARFNFELHYNTTGKPETDSSELGLYLAKEAPKMVLETRTAENRDFNIPPGEADARTHALYSFKRETLIYDLIPHMHLRGSWFKYEALYPDGRKETLLSVPNYDFNWQTEYRLAQPKRVPAGTWLLCTGGHDNSAKNPYNPDPTKRVKHGLQSFEEMFMGFMNVAEVGQGSEGGSKQASVEKQTGGVAR
jgi:mono/diheme cytochrome c family protein